MTRATEADAGVAVDGHGFATFYTQRTVAEVNVRRDGDVRVVVLYRRTQLAIRADIVVVRPRKRARA